jgi:CDP-L-myo-inositol myo-inositolphosphotransferase
MMARHAVILATDPALLAAATSNDKARIDYLTRVAGVPLLKRTILTVKRGGADKVIVLVGAGGERLHERLAFDADLTQDVSWVLLGEGEARMQAVLADLRLLIDRPFFLVRAGRVFQADALKRLGEHLGLAQVVSGVAGDGQGDRLRESGLYLCEPRLLDQARAEQDAPMPLEAALARAVSDGQRAKVDLGDAWVVSAHDRASARHATNLLIRALSKPTDGMVSRYINRRVSTVLTRLVMDWDVFIPNLFTFIALLMGLAAMLLVASGQLWGFAVGGLLYQLSSIVDGNDGEIARLKFRGSKLGGWLDTISDDITNLGFILALGAGVARASGQNGWLVLSVVAVSMGLFAVIQLYTYLLTNTELTTTIDAPWEVMNVEDQQSFRARFMNTLFLICKRDFYALLFAILCVAGLPVIPLILASIATIIMGTLKLKEVVAAWISSVPEPVRETTSTTRRQ